MTTSEDEAFELVVDDWKNISMVPVGLRDDFGFMFRAARRNAGVFEYASDELKKDQVLRLISGHSEVGEELSPTSVQRIVKLIEGRNACIGEFPDLVKNNRTIAMVAVTTNGFNIRLLPTEFQMDEKYIMTAIQRSPHSIQFIHESIIPMFIMMAIELSGTAIRYAPLEMQMDRKVARTAVMSEGMALEYIAQYFGNDLEIVTLAIEEAPVAIQFASDELRDNDKLATLAFSRDSFALRYVSERMREKLKLSA